MAATAERWPAEAEQPARQLLAVQPAAQAALAEPAGFG
jgi:hypothetical protein